MATAVIVVLLVACAFLFMKAHGTRTENDELKGQVASLKRQLAKRRG